MATENDLKVYAGDGATTFNWSILVNGAPMNIAGAQVLIAVKGAADFPDPTSGPDLFTVTNGITITSAVNGTGTWTLPALYTNQPGIFWWHGTVISGGVVATWGFGSITVAQVLCPAPDQAPSPRQHGSISFVTT